MRGGKGLTLRVSWVGEDGCENSGAATPGIRVVWAPSQGSVCLHNAHDPPCAFAGFLHPMLNASFQLNLMKWSSRSERTLLQATPRRPLLSSLPPVLDQSTDPPLARRFWPLTHVPEVAKKSAQDTQEGATKTTVSSSSACPPLSLSTFFLSLLRLSPRCLLVFTNHLRNLFRLSQSSERTEPLEHLDRLGRLALEEELGRGRTRGDGVDEEVVRVGADCEMGEFCVRRKTEKRRGTERRSKRTRLRENSGELLDGACADRARGASQ